MGSLLNSIKRNNKGSALLQAVIIFAVLLVIAITVSSLSFVNLNTSKKDSSHNTTYYASEACVQKGLEQVEYETAKYYAGLIAAQENGGGEFNLLYENFFHNIVSNAESTYIEPTFSESGYGGIATETSFSIGSIDEDTGIGEIIVRATSTLPDQNTRTVEGTLLVKRADIETSSGFWIGDNALTVGATFDMGRNNHTTVNNGNALLGALSYRHRYFPLTMNDGTLTIDVNAGDSITDNMSYATYPAPQMSGISLRVTSSSALNWRDIPESPVMIAGDEGISFTISNCTVPEPAGTIYCRGDLGVNNCVINADVYCDGNATISNCTINGNVYCKGNVTVSNNVLNGDVWCDGNISMNNLDFNGNARCGGEAGFNNMTVEGSVYAAGELSFHSTGLTDGIYYSNTKLTVSSLSANGAIFFSGGDMYIPQSVSVSGAVVVKNDLYFPNNGNRNLSVNYDEDKVNELIDDPDNAFFTGSAGGGDIVLDVTGLFALDSIVEVD